MSGAALFGVGIGLVAYSELERENRLLQLEVDSFRMELIRAGIETEHKGEKP